MDSDAHRRGRVVVATLARDGPTAPDRRDPSSTPTLIPPSAARTGPIPEASWPEALAPRAQEGLRALIGALSLRAVRSQRPT